MNTYYLRTIDYPQLLEMGVKLGVLAIAYEAYEDQEQEVDGMTVIVKVPIGDGTVYATDCGCLDYIGIIERPTGDTDEDGLPVTTPIVNPDGVPYLHANLITPHDIRALAEASDDPEIQEALADIGDWFIVDEEGNAVPPNNPHRIFG
jgi:hypothetical protein